MDFEFLFGCAVIVGAGLAVAYVDGRVKAKNGWRITHPRLYRAARSARWYAMRYAPPPWLILGAVPASPGMWNDHFGRLATMDGLRRICRR